MNNKKSLPINTIDKELLYKILKLCSVCSDYKEGLIENLKTTNSANLFDLWMEYFPYFVTNNKNKEYNMIIRSEYSDAIELQNIFLSILLFNEMSKNVKNFVDILKLIVINNNIFEQYCCNVLR